MSKRVVTCVFLILVAVFVYSVTQYTWQHLFPDSEYRAQDVLVKTAQYDGKMFYVFIVAGNAYQGTGLAVIEKKP